MLRLKGWILRSTRKLHTIIDDGVVMIDILHALIMKFFYLTILGFDFLQHQN